MIEKDSSVSFFSFSNIGSQCLSSEKLDGKKSCESDDVHDNCNLLSTIKKNENFGSSENVSKTSYAKAASPLTSSPHYLVLRSLPLKASKNTKECNVDVEFDSPLEVVTGYESYFSASSSKKNKNYGLAVSHGSDMSDISSHKVSFDGANHPNKFHGNNAFLLQEEKEGELEKEEEEEEEEEEKREKSPIFLTQTNEAKKKKAMKLRTNKEEAVSSKDVRAFQEFSKIRSTLNYIFSRITNMLKSHQSASFQEILQGKLDSEATNDSAKSRRDQNTLKLFIYNNKIYEIDQFKELLVIFTRRMYYCIFTKYLYTFVLLINLLVLVWGFTGRQVDIYFLLAESFVTFMLFLEVFMRFIIQKLDFFKDFCGKFDFVIMIICIFLYFESGDLWKVLYVKSDNNVINNNLYYNKSTYNNKYGIIAGYVEEESSADILQQCLTAFRFSTQLMRFTTFAMHYKRAKLPRDSVDFSMVLNDDL